MSDREDKFYADAISMLDAVKDMIIHKRLRGFAVVIAEVGKGIRTDFQTIDRGPQMAMLGGIAMLGHHGVCTVEAESQADDIEQVLDAVEAIFTDLPKGSMN